MVNRVSLNVTVANRSGIIGPTGFRAYDLMMNPYVGCQFGCKYCYVRWLVKDAERGWGDFVRVREHMADKLPKELNGFFRLPTGKRPKMKDGEPLLKNGKQVKETIYRTISQENARLVIGTMTDPYQPLERKHRITRTALDILLAAKPPLNKIGIFTRSPIILDDLDRIVCLPRKRVHFTVTPYPPDVLQRIEPIAIQTERRFETIKKLKDAGVRVHCNIAPAIPLLSDEFTVPFAKRLAALGVDEFFVDPMEAYKESFEALRESMEDDPRWPRVAEIMENKDAFADWKTTYRAAWEEAWGDAGKQSKSILPIWSDHIHRVWVDMRTGLQMDFKAYGDDLTQTD